MKRPNTSPAPRKTPGIAFSSKPIRRAMMSMPRTARVFSTGQTRPAMSKNVNLEMGRLGFMDARKRAVCRDGTVLIRAGEQGPRRPACGYLRREYHTRVTQISCRFSCSTSPTSAWARVGVGWRGALVGCCRGAAGGAFPRGSVGTSGDRRHPGLAGDRAHARGWRTFVPSEQRSHERGQGQGSGNRVGA